MTILPIDNNADRDNDAAFPLKHGCYAGEKTCDPRTLAPFTLVISSVSYPDQIQMRALSSPLSHVCVSVGQIIKLIAFCHGFSRPHADQGRPSSGPKGTGNAPEVVW